MSKFLFLCRSPMTPAEAALELAKQYPHLDMPGSEIEVHGPRQIPAM